MTDKVTTIGDKTVLAENATIVESTPIQTKVLDTGTDVVVVATTVGPNTIPYFDEDTKYVAKSLEDFGQIIVDTESVQEEINNAATSAAEQAAAAAVGPATAAAEGYANAASASATAAQSWAQTAETVADNQYTFHPTTADPTGTIQGLAGTTSGQTFRVSQGEGNRKSFIYYLNNNGVAVAKADMIGSGAVQDAINVGAGSFVVFGSQAKAGSVTAEYIDVLGNIEASVARRLRKVAVNVGETVFYQGRGRSMQTTGVTEIPGALFISETGEITVVEPTPLTINADIVMDSKYTPTVDGTFYMNAVEDTWTGFPTYGQLACGIIGQSIFYKDAYLTENDVGVAVSNQDLHEADLQSILAMGSPVQLTGLLPLELNKVLYKNGSIQDLAAATIPNSWAILYVPVRQGDKVNYYGVINASTTSTLTYMSQLDIHKKYVIDLVTDPTATGYQNIEATATQDGYIAIRVRLRNTDGSALTYNVSRTSTRYPATGGGGGVVTGTAGSIPAMMELLPIRLDNTWLYNTPSYQQNGIVIYNDYIYVVCIAEGRIPYILQRKVGGGEWKKFDLSTVPGNPLASPVVMDGHNSFSIGVTKDGYILVTGNHHVNNCRCVISTNPNSIDEFEAISYTTATVTYPRFVRHLDGTTQVFWRVGGSSNGFYYMNTFDDTTRTFGTHRLIIDATASNPYEQTIGLGNDGSIHLCWGYRTTSVSADANFGFYYAKSMDKGLTWTNAAGTVTYALPLSAANSENPIYVPVNTGYVNQNGGAVDTNNRYHTVYWQYDGDGYTQIHHLYYTAAGWRDEVVSRFTYTENVSGNLLNGTSSRPQICCTKYGKWYVVYRTTEMDKNGQIRLIDVTTAGAPVDFILTNFDIGKTEISLNVWDILQDNRIALMLTRGINRAGSVALWGSEPCWLYQAALP